jgi:hypothetical protein
LTLSLELGLYLVNEYRHLSYVAKMEWRAAPNFTLYQNLYYGPDQQASSVKYWRAFSDSTVEWRVPTWRVALSYDVGTEEVADTAGTPRAMWMGGALFTQLHLVGPWSVAIRPEIYWALEWGVSEVRNSKGPGSVPPFGECVSISK